MAVEVAAEPPNRTAKLAASATCPAARRRCSLGFQGDEQLVASYGLPTLKASLKVGGRQPALALLTAAAAVAGASAVAAVLVAASGHHITSRSPHLISAADH